MAFDDRVRIGMAQMLESVPAEIQTGLPTKKARQVGIPRFLAWNMTSSRRYHMFWAYCVFEFAAFFWKKMNQLHHLLQKKEGRHYREFRRFLQAFTAAAPFTLSQPFEAQIDWDLFHCESPAAMELADLVVPVVDRKTGGYFFVVLKGSHI